MKMYTIRALSPKAKRNIRNGLGLLLVVLIIITCILLLVFIPSPSSKSLSLSQPQQSPSLQLPSPPPPSSLPAPSLSPVPSLPSLPSPSGGIEIQQPLSNIPTTALPMGITNVEVRSFIEVTVLPLPRSVSGYYQITSIDDAVLPYLIIETNNINMNNTVLFTLNPNYTYLFQNTLISGNRIIGMNTGKDNTITINGKPLGDGEDNIDAIKITKPIKITLYLPDLQIVSGSGASIVDVIGFSGTSLHWIASGASFVKGLNLVYSDVSINSSGASHVILINDLNYPSNCKTLALDVSGAGIVDTTQFTTSTTNILASGASNVSVNRNSVITKNVLGASSVVVV